MWADYKYTIRNKLRQNKQNKTVTGGGKSKDLKFNSFENTIISILDMDEAVDGLDVHTYGASSSAFGQSQPFDENRTYIKLIYIVCCSSL